MVSYRKLEIYQLVREMDIDIYKMTLVEFPKFEIFEGRNQIRRSNKSVKTTIVEGSQQLIDKC